MEFDAQLFFDFAWPLRWRIGPGQAARQDMDAPERAVETVSKKSRGLNQIVSIDRHGRLTRHWQVPDLATARKMAGYLAERLPDQLVKVRRRIEVITTCEVDSDL
jgi:hypothetical protein